MSEPNLFKGTIAWFIRNPVAANLMMLLIIGGGIFSAITLEKKTMPELRNRLVVIEVIYPQASPDEVERGVVIKIEEAIEDVEGIKRIFSTSEESFGKVRVEVETNAPFARVMDEVGYQVDSINTFPAGAERPVIRRAHLEEDDVIQVQIVGDLDEKGLRELFSQIREELLMLPNVSRATIYDGRDYEIGIEISEEKLRRHGITFDEVANAVRAYSFDLSGGVIRTEGSDFRLRANAQGYIGQDFRDIILRSSPEGARLTVGDVAEVVDGFVEDDILPRFNGQPTLSMTVTATPSENDLKVAQSVKDFVERKNRELPDSVELLYWADVTPYLEGRIKLMLHNLGIGALLVFILLVLFLQIRLAFWVIIGIPVAFGGSLLLMPLFDVSLNMISMFGFILVLGIVVDDAIVIAENIHTKVQKEGPGMASVVAGAREVAMPATFGVLTTIVAFVPMTLVTGSFGPIWMSIGMVVILALVFSLVESKWILPSHLLHLKQDKHETVRWFNRPRIAIDRGLKGFIERVYRPLLKRAIAFRYTTIALFMTLALLSAGLINSGVVRFVFFPQIPSDFLICSLEMYPGTPVDRTLDGIKQAEQALRRLDERLISESGKSQIKHIRSTLTGRDGAEVIIELSKSEDRLIDAHTLAARWSEEIGRIPGAEAFKIDASITATGEADISLELTGQDIAQLQEASDELREALAQFDGVYNARNSLSEGNPEILLNLRPEAEARGLTLENVARQVRQGFYGEEAQRVQRGDEELKVMVRYPAADRRSLYHLDRTRIRAPDGAEIPFSQVADIEFTEGYASLERSEGLRVATVRAAVDKTIAEPGKIAGELVDSFSKNVIDERFPGISVKLAGVSEQEQESLLELLVGFVFAIVCIYALMAIPLRSYIQPLLIMTAIPFGLIGAVIGHLILGLPFSVLSLCGLIALSGVVVNDSIVFVDYVNRQRRAGLSAAEAALEAGPARFRAILLTSLTTFVGLIPIIAEKSLQAKIVIPMAVTLAFGILFATFITLLLLPTLYLVPEDLKGVFRKRARSPEVGRPEPSSA